MHFARIAARQQRSFRKLHSERMGSGSRAEPFLIVLSEEHKGFLGIAQE